MIREDILSRCNTQLIFRMLAVEDIEVVRDCFEGESMSHFADLPGYPAPRVGMPERVSLAMRVQFALPLDEAHE